MCYLTVVGPGVVAGSGADPEFEFVSAEGVPLPVEAALGVALPHERHFDLGCHAGRQWDHLVAAMHTSPVHAISYLVIYAWVPRIRLWLVGGPTITRWLPSVNTRLGARVRRLRLWERWTLLLIDCQCSNISGLR
jgi:hypothetical protein